MPSAKPQTLTPRNHFYDGWIYRRLIDPSLASIRRRVAALVPGGSRVLDVGCGTGDQLFHLADQIDSGICVEMSQVMVETGRSQAQQRGVKNCDFHLADARDLSAFADQSFDIAMSSDHVIAKA